MSLLDAFLFVWPEIARMILLLTSKPFSFLNIHWLSRGVHVVRGSAVGSVPRDVRKLGPGVGWECKASLGASNMGRRPNCGRTSHGFLG